MLKNESPFLFCLLLIMFSIVMVACNKTEDSTSEQQNNENKEEKVTRVVKTIHGDIEIPSKPKRIVVELNPDLIISANSENSAFEDFSKIAPTIIIPYETYKGAHEEVTAFGEMLGKEASTRMACFI
ncbi:hypothetical protein ACQKND_08495 [Viridibacillus arvi]|uniref:hypothetical protein n=1 Tax=Viridibacillus arvi TaxID=263475 RepID=UPI003CFE325E